MNVDVMHDITSGNEWRVAGVWLFSVLLSEMKK